MDPAPALGLGPSPSWPGKPRGKAGGEPLPSPRIAGIPDSDAGRMETAGTGTPQNEWLASLAMVSATLAHELIQPLSVVRLALQDAQAKLEGLDHPEGVQQDLRDALTACSRIGELIHGFRKLACPPGPQRPTQVHIHRVAQRTIRLLEQSARQAGIRVTAQNLEALPALEMREDELDQIFFALVQNAIQAADGGKDRQLLITGTQRQDTVVVQFQDDCGGVDPAHLPRIFEPFFTTKLPGQGTGLGLCIARRLVCQRGGQLTVESRRGQGTTFTLTLPCGSNSGMGGRYVR